jgi:hypothetical protein
VKLSAREVALLAFFAALSVVVIEVLGGIPIVGVPGASIKFDAVLAPIYGLVIGPYLGFLAALFGGLITASSPFSILTSFSPAVSALVAGFLTQKTIRGNGGRIKGWMLAAATLGLLIVGWYLTDVSRQAPLYPILHFAGLVIALASRNWIADRFHEEKVERKGWQVKSVPLLAGVAIMVVALMLARPYSADLWVLPYLSLPLFLIGGIFIVYSLFSIVRSTFVLAVSLASYCGIIADHMLGNLIYIQAVNILIPFSWIEDTVLKPLGLPDIPSLFMYMVPVSAVERITFTIVATILGVGLILAIRRANLLTRKSNQVETATL